VRRRRQSRTYLHPEIQVLISRREGLMLSQNEVGRRAHLAHSQISEWEAGRVSPNLIALKKWAAALGLTVSLERMSEWTQGYGTTTTPYAPATAPTAESARWPAATKVSMTVDTASGLTPRPSPEKQPMPSSQLSPEARTLSCSGTCSCPVRSRKGSNG
jgi:transcriptional regulator with XRE-family HTH domain